MRLSITLLGRELLGVEITTDPLPAPTTEPEAQERQPDGETPGPITDRSGNPVTQIGFTSSTPRPLT